MDFFKHKYFFLFVFSFPFLSPNFTGSALAQEASNAENQHILLDIDDEKAHYLVLQGSLEDVKMLLQSGYNIKKIHSCNTLLNTAIKSAARGTKMAKQPSLALEKIKLLINAGADVNVVPCPYKSMSALNWAVSLPSQVMEAEKIANKNINDKIKEGVTQCNIPGILSKPCKEVTPEERKKIREAFHLVFVQINKKLTPHFIEIIEYLVSNGAEINGSKENAKGEMPIHLAAMNPTIEPLKYLIEKGVDINVQDEYGNTPLFFAFGAVNNEAVSLLLNAGADINIRNKDGGLYTDVIDLEQIHEFQNKDE